MSQHSATLEEFKRFTGYDLTEEEDARITMLLQQAAILISSFLGTENWATPATSTLPSDNGEGAKGRQLHIVKRYYDNPDGVTSESYDGISVSLDDRAYEGLRLSAWDKQVLNMTRAKTKTPIQTISIHRNFGNIW